MPPLRPRVWMDQIDARKARRRCPGKELRRIAGKQAKVRNVVLFDLRENLRHAIDVRLAADEADVWISQRFCDQMFAPAKSDLKAF